ncbi:MAG: HIT family protein [Patescibacteria group bacterium]|nr:HIT family protein [Patescibacteria group bacterium]
MADCIFCKIVNREVPAFLINESENFLSFLDIYPHAPGHSLVIPKVHYQNFQHLPKELGEEFILVVQETMSILAKALKVDSFTLGINEGKLAGQVIPHFHFHLIPRFVNDGGGSIHAVVFNTQGTSVEEIYQRIKNES